MKTDRSTEAMKLDNLEHDYAEHVLFGGGSCPACIRIKRTPHIIGYLDEQEET